MPPERPLFSRIARSIQGRMGKLAEDNPDGALAKYLWLWQSIGRRPGRRLIPRPIRFFFMASLDLFSLVGWYVRTAILRVVRSARSKEAIMSFARTNRIAALTIVAGGVIGGLLTFSPLVLWSPADDVAEQMTADAQAIETTSPRRNSMPVVIDSVAVEGNIRLADLTIIAMGGLDQGSAYTIFDIQRATKAMWATGHFKDISVRVEGDVGDGNLTLIWEVDEKERADAISR